ncbi:MAG: class I SAM-dependent methyltransferase [Marinobacter sp.]|uniref:class I SAM-dependent methyltransferase n=1 Tax=Marinobacter sp. TaxID=50741 RepID=UPI00299ED841|nr:class I SAM-dependent methyltransferase [Marinobacter sp.]MDX1756200.1 class I SAM-dependent methyltransferase [Marinobacter sp.]
MADESIEQLAKVARDYDRLLTPSLFVVWNDHTLDAAHLHPGDKVLDVACGPGELTLNAARRVSPDGGVTGLDLNPGMLAVARSKSTDIDWLEGDAESLPFEDASFDAVLCQFGLMLFGDPVRAVAEMYRVLRPHRHLVVAVFDGLEQQPVYRTLADVYEQLVSPDVGELLRAPFSLGDPETLNGLFTSAGIHDTDRVRRQETARFVSLRDLVLADSQGWFPFAGVELSPDQIERVVREVESALSAYQEPDGTVEFRVSAHLVTATKQAEEDRNRHLAI